MPIGKKKSQFRHSKHPLFWIWEKMEEIKRENKREFDKINIKLKKIMQKQTDMAAEMAALTAQLAKIAVESSTSLQKVTDLETALANQDNVSPELQSAFDALKAQVKVVDDLVPDASAA